MFRVVEEKATFRYLSGARDEEAPQICPLSEELQ